MSPGRSESPISALCGMTRDFRLRRSLSESLSLTSSPLPFAVLGIGTSIVLLAKAWTERGYISALYGSKGLIQWMVSEAALGSWTPRIGWIAGPLSSLGVRDDQCLYLLFVVYVSSLAGLLFGWHTRLAAIVAWLSHMVINNAGILSSYGLDMFANIGLFYCALMPGTYKLNLGARPRLVLSAPSVSSRLMHGLLQLHLSVAYLGAGIEKAKGSEWLNGEAIWRALMMPQFHVRWIDLSWLASVPWVPTLVCWGTLLTEIGYCIFIWPRRTRHVWLLMTIGMHLGIAAFMGLRLFAAMMVVLNLAAFGSTTSSAAGRHTYSSQP